MRYSTIVCVVLEFHAMVVLSFRQHFNYDRQPYGVRMCQDLCRRIVGCSQYVFSAHNLVCRVNNKMDAIAAERRPDITTNSSDPIASCAWNTLVFSTRSGSPKCAKENIRYQNILALQHQEQDDNLSGIGHTVEDTVRVSEGARLLVVPTFNYSKRRFRELYIGDGAFELYPFINEDLILSIAYVQSGRRILVATSKPHQIKSFVLDNYMASTILRDMSAYGLCVDEGKQLVFFTALTPIKQTCRLSRMTITGEDFRVIYAHKDVAIDITLDPSKQRIYVSHMDKIRQLNYAGLHVSIIARGSLLLGITFHPTEDHLLYVSGGNVSQHTYFQKFLNKIPDHKLIPWNIVIHENVTYVSAPGGHALVPLTYFSLKGKRRKVISPKFDHNVTSNVVLCLVK